MLTHGRFVGKQLLLFIGEMVPKLKSRQSKATTSDGTSQSSGSGGSSKKKKGKKK